MATQPVVEQHIIFITPDNQINVDPILANSLVQALATNSMGTALILSIDHFRSLSGGVWTDHAFLEIKCYVPASFQATIQANMPALQAAFPALTVATWGYTATWGF